MDTKFFLGAMNAVGLSATVIDENTDFSKLGNPFEPEHVSLIRRIAGFKKYGAEMPVDGDDAMETLNQLIEQSRRLTGIAVPAEPLHDPSGDE